MASAIWSGTKTFSAASGEETLVAVPMPHRGILRGYSLVQTSGANAGAAAALYTSKQDATPNSDLPAETFRVVTLTIPASQAQVSDADTAIAYLNRDGTPTNAQRYLYLRITPAGTGSKNFVLSVTVETPMLI